MNETNGHFVSILICSRDRREALGTLVVSLKKIETDYPFEIVVVEETDDPSPITGTTYVSHPVANRGIPYARNLALAHAKGEIIVFLDDDCFIHKDWLNMLLEPFEKKSVVGVQGGVTVPENTNAVGWVETLLGFPGGGLKRLLEAEGNIQETREISTLNCAYRRSVIDKVGGFDERLKLGAEDYLLAKQVCEYGRCLFVPGAVVYHEARGHLVKIWNWFLRRGRSDIDVIRVGTWKRADTFLWLLKSSLVLKLLLLAAICTFWSNLAAILFLTGFTAYLTILYLRSFSIWKQANLPRSCLLILPIVKFTMDVAIDFGRLSFLFRALSSRGQYAPEKTSSHLNWK